MDGVDIMQRELERGHHAEVAATAAQGPEQVRLGFRAGPDEPAVGEDHVRGEEVVAGEPVLACQVADPAAECEPGDAGGAEDAAGAREPEGVRGVVVVAPRRPGLCPGTLLLRVDPDAAAYGEVEDESVVDRSEAGCAVAAAPDGEVEPCVAREPHRGDHVGSLRDAQDRGGMFVDHPVEHVPGGLVALVIGLDHGAADALAERVEGWGGHVPS
ncbi:hypothetical protein GCM10009849_11550 [Sinomonas flava]|uniref:Uncharacterized protein n=1 Tax=Sinomonas flava TaxID=496857 RepID=A0ABN3BNN8_9MICC